MRERTEGHGRFGPVGVPRSRRDWGPRMSRVRTVVTNPGEFPVRRSSILGPGSVTVYKIVKKNPYIGVLHLVFFRHT